jgi:hypothetical protein
VISRQRSPNGINVHRFLDEFGVTVRRYDQARSPRPANVVYGGRVISRLLRQNPEQCRTVIMAIQASNPHCFDDVMIWSVWCFVKAHAADQPRQAVITMFSTIDIAEIKKRAHRLVSGANGRMGKTPEKISTLLADKLLEKDDA